MNHGHNLSLCTFCHLDLTPKSLDEPASGAAGGCRSPPELPCLHSLKLKTDAESQSALVAEQRERPPSAPPLGDSCARKTNTVCRSQRSQRALRVTLTNELHCLSLGESPQLCLHSAAPAHNFFPLFSCESRRGRPPPAACQRRKASPELTRRRPAEDEPCPLKCVADRRVERSGACWDGGRGRGHSEE